MQRLFSIILLSLCVGYATASEAPESDPLDLTVSQNIETPEVPKKAKRYVLTAVSQLRQHLTDNGFEVETLRDGEVLQLSIPCSQLFAPCSIQLKPSAGNILSRLGSAIRTPGKYKVLVAVHSDDTGDDQYADSITAGRANALDDYFWELNEKQDTSVIPYGIGNEEPLQPNNTRANREANRRVEITIVPDYVLFEMAGVKRKKR